MSNPAWRVSFWLTLEEGSIKDYIEYLSAVMQEAQSYGEVEITDIESQGIHLNIKNTVGEVFP